MYIHEYVYICMYKYMNIHEYIYISIYPNRNLTNGYPTCFFFQPVSPVEPWVSEWLIMSQ